MHCDDSGIHTRYDTSVNASSQDFYFLPDNPDGPYRTWEGWKQLNSDDYFWNQERNDYCDRHQAGDTRVEITEHTPII